MSRLVRVTGVYRNELSETLTFRVDCDQKVEELLLAIARKEEMTKEEMALEVASLLERSIHLNMPGHHSFYEGEKND